MAPITLVGRSSSHFTRVARIVALELAIEHAFQPVFDLTALDAAAYAGNPALKIPILVDEAGPLFGTENICRALVRRAGARDLVVRGELPDRIVANAEELVLHAMAAEVSLIMARVTGDPGLAPDKLRRSLEGCLAHLDAHVDAVRAALPADRRTSFVEIALYCLVRHLAFREVCDVTPYARLAAFCDRFDARASAAATPYHFDPRPA